MTKANKTTVEQVITDRFLSALGEGNVPWQKSWSSNGIPRNLATKKPYRGVNFLMLLYYGGGWFATYKQARQLGGQVKKGSHGYPVIFYKLLDKKPTEIDKRTGKPKQIPLLRYSTVFPVGMIDGLEAPDKVDRDNDRVEDGEALFTRNDPKIEEGRPAYHPLGDYITMPDIRTFNSSEDYYAVGYHELVHWSGGKPRLDRICHDTWGDNKYSQEELIAEVGSAFLRAYTGITSEAVEENSTGYVQHWAKVLQNDPKMIIRASSLASKAVDYLMGNEVKTEEEGE
jgi:antirestriction protein ArdC